jgi:hypothetical protein
MCSVIAAPTTSCRGETRSIRVRRHPIGFAIPKRAELRGFEDVEINVDVDRTGEVIERLLEIADAIPPDADLLDVVVFRRISRPFPP